MKTLLILCLILSVIYAEDVEKKKVVCYWNSNSEYHSGLKGYFKASDIDPNICTHIIYTYIRFSERYELSWSFRDMTEEFLNLKTRNENIKLLIGVGGPQWGQTIPSNIVSTETGRDLLSKAIKKFLDDRPGFDGCDIDWQYPAQGNGKPEDFENFPKFLNLLRETIPAQKSVSISVATRNEDIQKSYDVPRIVDIVDFVNLNAFDLRGMGSDTVTAFHSPYRKDPNDRTPEAEWNAESIINSWLTRASPANKLTLGIATYGRSFTLSNKDDNGVGSPVSGQGRQSNFLDLTRAEKINVIPYAEICWNLNQEGTQWRNFWSDEHFAPFATFDNQWVGYDDRETVLAKIHLVLDNELGGVNYASIDYEDFAGNCGSKYPLINLGYEALVNGNFPPNPVDPTTTTPRPGVTETTTTVPDEITPPEPTITTTTESNTQETEPTTETTTETNPETEETTTQQTETNPTTVSTTTRTTTSRTTTSSVTFQTPPVTPSTTQKGEDPITVPSTENPSNTDEGSSEITPETTTIETTEQSEETTAQDFKTPPVTPATKDPADEDSNEVTDDGSFTTEGDSDESSGESSEYSSSEEDSNENPDERTTEGNDSGEVTDDTTIGNDSGEVTDDTTIGNDSGEVTDDTTIGNDSGEVTDETTVGNDSGEGTDETTLPDGATPPNGSAETSETTTGSFNFVCPIPNGNFKHPNNCSKFIICANYIPYEFNCQEGLYYDEVKDQCIYSAEVQCNA